MWVKAYCRSCDKYYEVQHTNLEGPCGHELFWEPRFRVNVIHDTEPYYHYGLGEVVQSRRHAYEVKRRTEERLVKEWPDAFSGELEIQC